MRNRCTSPHTSNAILWAAAILCSAIVGAPAALTLLFLPVLAWFSLRSIRVGPKPPSRG